MRLIDADALIETFEIMGLGENGLIERIFADGVFTIVENAPTIEAEPVRHGRWVSIRIPSKYGGCVVECSECNNRGNRNFTYCQSCGAKMDLEG